MVAEDHEAPVPSQSVDAVPGYGGFWTRNRLLFFDDSVNPAIDLRGDHRDASAGECSLRDGGLLHQ